MLVLERNMLHSFDIGHWTLLAIHLSTHSIKWNEILINLAILSSTDYDLWIPGIWTYTLQTMKYTRYSSQKICVRGSIRVLFCLSYPHASHKLCLCFCSMLESSLTQTSSVKSMNNEIGDKQQFSKGNLKHHFRIALKHHWMRLERKSFPFDLILHADAFVDPESCATICKTTHSICLSLLPRRRHVAHIYRFVAMVNLI